MHQAKTRNFLGSVPRLAILTGVPVFLLLTCHPPERITPQYISPRIISDNFVFFYPPEAYENQLEGTVTLRVRIQKSGYVGEAEIFESSGYEILDDAALAMARTVHFKPGQVGGETRDLWMTWPVVFRLTSVPMSTLNLMEWQRKALEYQSTASTETPMRRRFAQTGLFAHYANLGAKMVKSRSVFPNKTIMRIVASPIRDSWAEYQDIWPLPFVLFQDYVARFPESKHVNRAEGYLVDYIMDEISLLKEASADDSPLAVARQQLLNDLTRFLEEHYPEAL